MNIVITGASYGLGRALAIAFSRQEAQVALLARNAKNLEITKSLMKNSDQHFIYSFDLCKKSQIIATTHQIQSKFSHIDVLINNAAGWNTGHIEEMKDEAIEEQITVTITGTMLFTKHLLPLLKRSKQSHIINIASTAALPDPDPSTSSVAYCASKWGFAGFSESLRAELKPERIKVTTIYPGTIATDSSIDDTQQQIYEKFGPNTMGVNEVVQAIQFCLTSSSTGYIHSLTIRT
jgi:short-subunit dehydrogenase